MDSIQTRRTTVMNVYVSFVGKGPARTNRRTAHRPSAIAYGETRTSADDIAALHCAVQCERRG